MKSNEILRNQKLYEERLTRDGYTQESKGAVLYELNSMSSQENIVKSALNTYGARSRS